MSDPLTDAELAAMRSAATDPATPPWVRGHLCALLAEVERLRDQLRERWPYLTHQMRDRLLALCQAAGTDAGDKWLSEAACETVERLRADNELLKGPVLARCEEIGQALLAGRPPTVSDPAGEPLTEQDLRNIEAEYLGHNSDVMELIHEVRRVRTDNAALCRQVAALAECCHGQSEALARRAGRPPVVSDPDREP